MNIENRKFRAKIISALPSNVLISYRASKNSDSCKQPAVKKILAQQIFSSRKEFKKNVQ